jgi:hypothetical protein
LITFCYFKLYFLIIKKKKKDSLIKSSFRILSQQDRFQVVN